MRSGKFRLLGKKSLLQPEHRTETVVVDVTEFPIERPKRRQKQFYSGKKKGHTLKSQLVVNLFTRVIVRTADSKHRVVAELVNRPLKIFKILSERYRNRRRRFGLGCNLISANL